MDISIKGKNVFHLKKSKFISKNDKEIKRQINKYYHVIPLFSLDFNANQNRSSPLHSTFFLRFLFQKEINPSHASTKKTNKSSKTVSPNVENVMLISYSFNDGTITLPIELEKNVPDR